MDTNEMIEFFGEPVYGYTRKQAIEDGEQISVSDTAKQAGLKIPVFITRGVFDSCVALDDDNETGRLWDILFLLRVHISANANRDTIPFTVKIKNRNRQLIAQCGAMDIDDPQPAITIMLPEEI